MHIREIMTRPVEVVSPEDTVRTAAKRMIEADCGVLPVGEDHRLVGMLSDRDIVTRAVAEGYDPDECYVREIMSRDVQYCYEDETPDDLSHKMRTLQVKRLPVLDRERRLVGIVSLGDLATTEFTQDAAERALNGISQPGRRHLWEEWHARVRVR